MKTNGTIDHTFTTPEAARDAVECLNGMGGNCGNVVAFIEGCRVYLRPAFTSARLMMVFDELVRDLEAAQ